MSNGKLWPLPRCPKCNGVMSLSYNGECQACYEKRFCSCGATKEENAGWCNRCARLNFLEEEQVRLSKEIDAIKAAILHFSKHAN